MVIADTLSQIVSKVYDYPQRYHGFVLVLATIFFTFQIYCDFSGYSDIVVGAAKLMGIDLMMNLKSPYFSQSVKKFWGRWHISLSTWFKDYVYIPLGGNRVGKIRHYFKLIVTFLVSGLWHEAKMVVAGYPIAYSKYTEFTDEDFSEFKRALEDALDCEVVSDYTDYFFSYEHFYNSRYHLTNEGAEMRTNQLIMDIRKWMECN